MGNLKKVLILKKSVILPTISEHKNGHFWSFFRKKKVKKRQKTASFGSPVKKIHYSHSFYKRLNKYKGGSSISRGSRGSMGPRRSSIGSKLFENFFRFIRLKWKKKKNFSKKKSVILRLESIFLFFKNLKNDVLPTISEHIFLKIKKKVKKRVHFGSLVK